MIAVRGVSEAAADCWDAGSHSANVAPLPGEVVRAIRPPAASIHARAIGRPIPVETARTLVLKYGSKHRAATSGAMP